MGKIRRKAEKAMKKEVKAKLYSNFVKSGTLTGGKMEENEEGDSGFVEDKDLSLLRTLTDDELVKACGGRTAHKGGRHGHRINAKLARIEKAEAEYMLDHKSKEEAAAVLAEDRVCARLVEDQTCTRSGGEGVNEGEGVDKESAEGPAEVKRKKKKRKKDKDSDGIIESDSKIFKGDDTREVIASVTVEPNLETKHKKKKSKGGDNIGNQEPQEEAGVLQKKKKSKKSEKVDEVPILEEVPLKKKKKTKRKKLKGGSD